MLWTVNVNGGPRLSSHSNTAVAVREKIYFFGDNDGQYISMDGLMDLQILQSDTYRWSVLKGTDFPSSQITEIPCRRRGHTAALYNDKVFIWGGMDKDNVACNTILYCFNSETHIWSKPSVSGTVPTARHDHSACIFNGSMYIFGGFEDQSKQYFNDLHKLDLETFKWSKVDTTGEKPTHRAFHSATAINNRMYIFGGFSGRYHDGPDHNNTGPVICNEMVYLDTQTSNWINPVVNGFRPGFRTAHSAFYYKDKFFVFGGLHDDTHNLLCYEPDSCRWSTVDQRENGGPCRRIFQCCCLVGDRVFLLGGTRVAEMLDGDGDEEFVKDLHVLDFEPSLKTLAIMAVLENKLDQDKLPETVRDDIKAMTLPYSDVTQPLNDVEKWCRIL